MNDTAEERLKGRLGMAGLMLKMFFRARIRFLAVFTLFAILSFMFSGVAMIRQAVEMSAAIWSGRLGADLMIIPAGSASRLEQGLVGGAPVRLTLPPETEGIVRSIPGVKQAASQYFLVSARSDCCESGNLLLVGFDPARDFTVRPWLNAGVTLQPGDGEILIGSGVMKGRGAELKFYNRNFTVAARLEKSGMGYFDNAVFIPIGGVEAMERSSKGFGRIPLTVTWGRPSMVLVKLDPSVDSIKTADLLKQSVPGVQVLTLSDLFREKRGALSRVVSLQKPLFILAWLFALAAAGAVQLLYWRERRPVLGLLQAWGRSKLAISGTAALETLIISLLSMVAGSVAAFLLIRMFSTDLATVIGIPLLARSGSMTASGMPMIWIAFAGTLAVETLVIMLFMLREDLADMMRGS